MLHHEFIKTAKKLGSKTAIVDRTTGKTLSFSRTLIASLLLARKFKKYDEGFLGIMLPTSAGCALSTVAALLSGRTPVMINYSTGADKNTVFAQKKCDFHTVITSKALLEKIDCPKVQGMVFLEDIMETVSKLDKVRAALASKLPLPLLLSLVHGAALDDTAVILFTSGSEKDPKAVQLTHKNILSNIQSFSEAGKFTQNDLMLANLPFFHVFGLTVNLWAPLVRGMTMATYANPTDYKTICDIVREEKPTIVVGTPSFLLGYLRKSEPGDFKSVRLIISGADKCPEALRAGFLEKHGLHVYEGYGTTETSPGVSVNIPEHNRPGSIGKLLPGVQVAIENYETGQPCPTGEVGRILVKGDMVMKGYLDDFEETSMRIRQGWYDTGDMGYMDEDGFLWHSGRLKRFVKIGGEMVSLVKVEEVLEANLPTDVLCCVVEVPDARKGARIVAAVTEEIQRKKVLKAMARDLPNLALPKEFVVMQDLPKLGSGKIDFRTVSQIVHDLLLNGTP